MFGILISLTRNQNMLCFLCMCFEILYFLLKYFQHIWHGMLQMSFTHEGILIWGYTVTFVERSSRLNGTWKIIRKKYIVLAPSQRYPDFWQLLDNTKIVKILLGFSNHAHRFTLPYYLDVDNPLLYCLLLFFIVYCCKSSNMFWVHL